MSGTSDPRPAPDWLGDVSAGVDAWTKRAPTPPDPAAERPDADPESVARKILLDQLTGQARSRKELSDKLAARNVPAEIATRLLDRFEEVGLVDDEAFARSWVQSRQPGKKLARRALAQELRRKGVADEVAREVLEEVDPAAEERPPGRWCASGCARSRRSTTPPRPGAWSACWPARAMVPASPSPWCATSWPAVGDNARVASEREVLTYELFGTAVHDLAQQVVDSGYEPDIVLSIARGGLGLGMGLGYALDVKNLSAINVEFYTGVDERLELPVVLPPTPDAVDLAGLKVLIADDVADTGRTLEIVRDFCADHVAEARIAVIYEKPWTVVHPDYVWRRTEAWIDFPWSAAPPLVRRQEVRP